MKILLCREKGLLAISLERRLDKEGREVHYK